MSVYKLRTQSGHNTAQLGTTGHKRTQHKHNRTQQGTIRHNDGKKYVGHEKKIFRTGKNFFRVEKNYFSAEIRVKFEKKILSLKKIGRESVLRSTQRRKNMILIREKYFQDPKKFF